MNNEDLKKTYDEFHKVGVTSWFSDGKEERETILKMGEPWHKSVLEIGCGEGLLAKELIGNFYHGVDFSAVAISKAKMITDPHFPEMVSECKNYKEIKNKYDRIVMQGVLEHLDNPFTELKWMIDNLLVKGGDVITSSPCFLNPRGIVWMTLDMLGAVMSKTDLHYLDPMDFIDFCHDNKLELFRDECDFSWGNAEGMIQDLRQRIPLALRDGNLPYNKDKVDRFLEWLDSLSMYEGHGATMVYRIST